MQKGCGVWVEQPEGNGGLIGSSWRRGTVTAAGGAAVSVALDPERAGAPPMVVSVPASIVQPANPALLDAIRCAALEHAPVLPCCLPRTSARDVAGCLLPPPPCRIGPD